MLLPADAAGAVLTLLHAGNRVHVYIVKNHCISIIVAVRANLKAFLPTDISRQRFLIESFQARVCVWLHV